MEKDATDSYSCKQDKYAPFSFFTSSSVLFFTSSSVLFYSQTAFFSASVSLYSIIKPSKISFFLSNPLLYLLLVLIFPTSWTKIVS